MSRRASLHRKENPGKPRVRFPDELVFRDSVKENDVAAMESMLRRVSLEMDINGLSSSGLTPLHQAVLDGHLVATRLLIKHGADVNKRDEDSWTPLHAACAEGHAEVARYLIKKGADPARTTSLGERPLDLCQPGDLATIAVLIRAHNKRKS